MDTDFSRISIHTDSMAVQMNQDLGANAFTHGSGIYFNKGQYNPTLPIGKHLLVHELTHVVQQGYRHKKIQRAVSFEDCENNAETYVATAHSKAIEMVEHSVSQLNEDPVTDTTKEIFANHFGAYADWRRDIVVNHLNGVLSMLKHDRTYECETEDCDAVAFTYWIFGDIHLCVDNLPSDLNEMAETIIHEHKHLHGSFDLGYYENNQDNDTVWSVAINNADSFSELCQDLFEQP